MVPHILRHSCASRLVQAGIDLRRVQTFLGHQTIQMTLRYAHLATNDLDQCATALNAANIVAASKLEASVIASPPSPVAAKPARKPSSKTPNPVRKSRSRKARAAKLKWSCILGQFCGSAKMHRVCNHAAFRISALSKYAASGVRLSSAVCGRSVLYNSTLQHP